MTNIASQNARNYVLGGFYVKDSYRHITRVFVNQFLVAAYLWVFPSFVPWAFMPSAVILTQSGSFHLIKFRLMSQNEFFIRAESTTFFWLCVSSFSFPSRVLCEVMENLAVSGESIKFVDRKSWKRDSFGLKLNFEKKMFEPMETKLYGESKSGSSNKIRRKCPIEIEFPHKRRILKRPKRFKNYYSDRKPLSIPRFSFPRCLVIGESSINTSFGVHDNMRF